MSTIAEANHKYNRPQLEFLASSTGDSAIDADLAYIQTLNWSETSLGSLESWPSDLLVLVNLAMLSPQPQLFLLGPESIILYNTAYGRLLRDHHPEYQGRPIHLNDALIAQTKAIDRIVSNADTRSQPANENHVPFFMSNAGQLEEVFLSATMVKLPQQVGSFHATTYDTTPDIVKARRDKALAQIMTEAASATSLRSLWDAVINGIASTDGDIPFAAIYTARTWLEQDTVTAFVHSNIDTQHFTLHGLVGDYVVQPASHINFVTETGEGWLSVLSKARRSREPLVLEKSKGHLPDVFSQASRTRCYEDDCRSAIVFPSNLGDDEDVHALFVLGLAPRRPFDNAYRSWTQALQRTIANLAGSIAISEAKMLAAQNDAKRTEQEALSHARELSIRDREALLAAGKVQRMLDVMQSANVGMFECSLSGDILYVNEAFSTLTGHPQAIKSDGTINIFELCCPEQTTILKDHWNELLDGQLSSFTLSFGDNKQSARWVQAACTPVIHNDSLVESITGCVTDITAQKRVEVEATRRAEALEQLRLSELRLLQDAIEAKRQQENFIDMTSHEIRNPLSAVIHCADSLSQTLQDMKNALESAVVQRNSPDTDNIQLSRLQELRQEAEDMVEVISSCTTHQKRITDDILSLSKLNSNLLEIFPSKFDLKKFLDQLNFTFTAEAQRAQVKLTMRHDQSLHGVRWIEADSGRLMQVLINLVANAIKFTKNQAGPRVVTVSTSIFDDIPAETMRHLSIVKGPDASTDIVEKSLGSTAYLWFDVHDTGCGMNAEARSRIFSRFSQASPKTYSTYGGSGLGLFVSQRLVSLQGGKIGFKSEEGSGSNFAFYVKVHKRFVPEDVTAAEHLSSALPQDVKAFKLSLQGLSILLVEDNAVNRKVLKKQLQRSGFTVHTAEHGRAALDFIATTRHWITGGKDLDDHQTMSPSIDVILMDVEMPVMNGRDCTAAIRLAERKGRIDHHIPIIAITANARPEQLRQTVDSGMDDAISKPFHVHDLLHTIENLLQKQTTIR